MLNTFFFGYLALKWKRLARVISIGFLLTVPLWIFVETVDEWRMNDFEAFSWLFFLPTFFALLIGVVSWVLKPFIVKD